uniref:HECT domain-containing protein n=1 Tax=Pycnococcus provasolii TaxID=41880 RepID=A0A7S2F376_9CHLO|mmetsp:Transcript_1180/g.2585  ORF Transcript_1180/g.2585 Transcript_1180/m.2585 type:complete len:762 (+) Transcript_1180:453-2738(+)
MPFRHISVLMRSAPNRHCTRTFSILRCIDANAITKLSLPCAGGCFDTRALKMHNATPKVHLLTVTVVRRLVAALPNLEVASVPVEVGPSRFMSARHEDRLAYDLYALCSGTDRTKRQKRVDVRVDVRVRFASARLAALLCGDALPNSNPPLPPLTARTTTTTSSSSSGEPLHALTSRVAASGDAGGDEAGILALLRTLHEACRCAMRLTPEGSALLRVPESEFISRKLSTKLTRQLQDVLVVCTGGLPLWCRRLVCEHSYLFPFALRRQYFQLTSLGISRALNLLQEQQDTAGERSMGGGRDLRVGRVQRQKVRIGRERILESAEKVMEMYCGQRTMLEVEFFGEVGTGLGPTLEFYSLLSKAMRRRDLKMWRDAGDMPPQARPRCASENFVPMEMDGVPEDVRVVDVVDSDDADADDLEQYVHAPHGLFPQPLPPASVPRDSAARKAEEKTMRMFRLLGRAAGKALYDNRLLDLPLHPVFVRAVLLGVMPEPHDVLEVDPVAGESMLELVRAAREGTGVLHGVSVDSLGLTFVVPGADDVELVAGGSDVSVTSGNFRQYAEAVLDATIGSGVTRQLEASRSGFLEVLPEDALKPFTAAEVDELLCGAREDESWSADNLLDLISWDHGYSRGCVHARMLAEVMAEFTPRERRGFLAFVTGSPRLPSGGLAALHPPLTVVRKSGEGSTPSGTPGTTPATPPSGLLLGASPGASTSAGSSDGLLPSAMTCASYLKLPPYSSKSLMRERIKYVVAEGAGSFHLS